MSSKRFRSLTLLVSLILMTLVAVAMYFESSWGYHFDRVILNAAKNRVSIRLPFLLQMPSHLALLACPFLAIAWLSNTKQYYEEKAKLIKLTSDPIAVERLSEGMFLVPLLFSWTGSFLFGIFQSNLICLGIGWIVSMAFGFLLPALSFSSSKIPKEFSNERYCPNIAILTVGYFFGQLIVTLSYRPFSLAIEQSFFLCMTMLLGSYLLMMIGRAFLRLLPQAPQTGS